MNSASLEHIEAKVINFLHDTKVPHHASQIATQIREKREETLRVIQRLVRNGTIKGVQDFTLLNSTGEITAYVLDNAAVPPALPSAPPPPPAPRAHRRPVAGG